MAFEACPDVLSVDEDGFRVTRLFADRERKQHFVVTYFRPKNIAVPSSLTCCLYDWTVPSRSDRVYDFTIFRPSTLAIGTLFDNGPAAIYDGEVI